MRSMGNIQNGATLTRRDRGDELLKKSYFFLCVQKVFSSQMDYPGDAFHSFLNLDSGIYLAVNGTVTSLPVFI